jgi:catechol 2,3-dioxygenase-like lactoylglutathione lyase family enzyme
VKQSLVHVALVVRNYDEAIAFFTRTLGFTLIEDTYIPEQDGRVRRAEWERSLGQWPAWT